MNHTSQLRWTAALSDAAKQYARSLKPWAKCKIIAGAGDKFLEAVGRHAAALANEAKANVTPRMLFGVPKDHDGVKAMQETERQAEQFVRANKAEIVELAREKFKAGQSANLTT